MKTQLRLNLVAQSLSGNGNVIPSPHDSTIGRIRLGNYVMFRNCLGITGCICFHSPLLWDGYKSKQKCQKIWIWLQLYTTSLKKTKQNKTRRNFINSQLNKQMQRWVKYLNHSVYQGSNLETIIPLQTPVESGPCLSHVQHKNKKVLTS